MTDATAHHPDEELPPGFMSPGEVADRRKTPEQLAIERAARKAALGMSDEELIAHAQNPHWRLWNLYWITDKDGNRIKFRPWPEQEKFLDEIWFRNIVLKARQRGFSTIIQLMMLDACMFNGNLRAAVIAQDQVSAEIIFRDKVKFAYDNLPDVFQDGNPLERDSQSELLLHNNSSLRVAISARSGTLQWLHVSEFGKICARRPDVAREIVTGSLPAVDRNGIVVIESTAEGAEGEFHDMAKKAEALAESQRRLSRLEYKFHFAPWIGAAEYEVDVEDAVVSPADNAYFERMEVDVGREITPRQRAWYVSQRDNAFSGDAQKMKQEYPSTPKEAFEQSTEGTYYSQQLTLARMQGRIADFPYIEGVAVDTWWDLGVNDDLVLWCSQKIGMWVNFIDYFECQGEPYATPVRWLQQTPYIFGRHYLPHDGEQRRAGAESIATPAQMLDGLGLKRIEVVPRIPLITTGIMQVRAAFNRYRFDQTKCKEGLRHLTLYRKQWVERTSTWSDLPRHDEHSNAADALRGHAQAEAAGLIISESGATSATRINRKNKSGLAA